MNTSKAKYRFASYVFFIASALLILSIIVQAPSSQYWFDTSWHFRVNFTISNTDYARSFWPVELKLNFTDLIRQAGKNGTFDNASIRVFEHNSSGDVLFQQPYQFESAADFNASANAVGMLTFFLNGTTAANQTRYIYVYFDIVENGAKSPASFSSKLNYSWDGEEAQVNNSFIRWKIDTLRGENTSGFYDARGVGGNIIFRTTSAASTTKEYIQYSNGTYNFSFDFRNNATFYSGPLKLVIEQAGNETLWNNPNAKTGFGIMKKRYTFYENSSWVKIEQNFTNSGASSITRNSTSSGALSINELSTSDFLSGVPTFFGNETNPFSWYGASDTGSRGVGLINVNYTGNANYYAINNLALDRLGINLETATIAPGESITETAIMQFDDDIFNQEDLLLLRNQFAYPPVIVQGGIQFMPYYFSAKADYMQYNLKDTVLVFGNTTYDPNSVIYSMNATIDMGTQNISDDVDITLYDDGNASHGDLSAADSIFSNLFNLSQNSTKGMWNITIMAYDSGGVLLNQNSTVFNLTDIYIVSLYIWNPDGFVDRLVNATITVKNSRNDTYIGSAELNCSYGAGLLTNITDYLNGTYILNFTAPPATGAYTLDCNASKFNNTGADAKPFYTETSETIMSVNISPQNHTSPNISLSSSESFALSVNTTDIGGANARSVNITLSLPQNISSNSTFESCGDVVMASSCIRQFNITVSSGTPPGNYTINASTFWRNPDNSTNSTNASFIAYVLSNPIMNASPAAGLSGTVADGKTAFIGNFTVNSVGNDNITNVTFNVSGLSDFTIVFSPVNISTLGSSQLRNVSVNVTVPSDYTPGNYSGTINISSVNGGWVLIGLNITVPGTTSISLAKSPQNYTSSKITFYSGDYFNMSVTAQDTGIADAKSVNITLSMPQNLSSNSTFESCGRVNASLSCIKSFNITISNMTVPGNYTFNITSSWLNPDLSVNSTALNFTVQVMPNPLLNASGEGILKTMPDNSSGNAGNFTVISYGNSNLTNITFSVTGLPNFTIQFSPNNISSLQMNESQNVQVNVSVPFAYSPGNYSGIINISSVNGGWKTVDLNISVSARREWSMSLLHCDRAENPESGTVCIVTVQNTGNAPINYTVNPSSVNYTSVNETSITVAKNSSYAIAFLYNVSNITKDFYYANYTINATEPDAVPSYYDFSIMLIPYVVPLFSLNMTPSLAIAPQQKNIEILVNVTDRSTTGINWTVMNVTLPNGTIETYNMSLVGINGTFSQWYFNYSGNMSQFINYTGNGTGNGTGNISNYTGSTLMRGIYNITISSQDNTGVIGSMDTNFTIYAKMLIGFMPGSSKYYQGSTGSIYYTLTDAQGAGLEGANVTIAMNDSKGNTIYFKEVTVNSAGQVSPIQTFLLANDAPTGLYNITANMTYYDTIVGVALTSLDKSNFTLQSGSAGGGGGLTADLDTAVVWYPDNVMRFEMWFSYAGNVTDPDDMTLYVYDPADNLYFNITLANANRTVTGLYSYKYAMPISTASGYYRAVLTASKDGFVSQKVKPFRVAKGGPYDVRIKILNYEVPRSDYLNFEIFIENMGEVTQDVYIDYWTSYDNETYYYNSEAILTPAGQNKTISRTAYIFSNQPLGINLLNVKVAYDSVQPPIMLNASFEVIDETIEIPPPPAVPPYRGGGGGGGSGTGSGGLTSAEEFGAISGEEGRIEIESYTKDINVVKGWTALGSVKVKNAGKAPINNITLQLVGVSSSWFKITPKNYEKLMPGNDTIFLVEFKIPENANSGTYVLTLTASSNESIIDKTGRLIVFTTIEELIKNDLTNLKLDIEKLQDDSDFAGKIGKDVSAVKDLISQARAQIKLAEDNLAKKAFEDSLQNIQTASGLVKRAKNILEYPVKIPEQKESIWILGLKVILVVTIIASFGLWSLKYRGKLRLEPLVLAKKQESKEVIEERRKEFMDEKASIIRVMNLLDQELKDGVITQNAYNELKKRNEEKLARIEIDLKRL